MKIQINSPLMMERIGNKLWILIENFNIRLDDSILIITKGFVTDGASCPFFLWWLCPPVGDAFGEAAVVHDYLYSPDSPKIKRSFADQVLYWIGVYRHASVIRAKIVLLGVSLFGWRYFKKPQNKITEKTCYNYKYAINRIKELQRITLE